MHGSPRRINEYLFEDRPEYAMVRMADEYPYPAIFFGHTHVPYARLVGETTFVNVGSGGRPKDGDWRVCYASSIPHGWDARLRRVRARALRLREVERELAATPLITSFAGPPPAVEGVTGHE